MFLEWFNSLSLWQMVVAVALIITGIRVIKKGIKLLATAMLIVAIYVLIGPYILSMF